MLCKIVIVNYGMGNLSSIKRKLNLIGLNAVISSEAKDIENADKLILPGVGHFQKAIRNIKELELFDIINEIVLVKKKPILGICLGMQLMAKASEEGDCNGFGWFDANVVKFKIKDKLNYKIPHTGWNQIDKIKESKLMENIPEYSEFYFVHSYHFKCNNSNDILNVSEYEYKFTSAVEKDNIFGVQYHPEKSHGIGEKLLKNFIYL